ncbi:hypothetical protein Y032_0177g603 [Ancylostoma ceylanicum]|uniref:Uncharacterized protein n=1 Tax=Ancylostoma ceylanicum TaxID=53326 RepID=A0A016STV9_9BILA|nr:hypothetical protein Y032_0177g603 [Ancylostoma ceylanicum]
MARSAQQARKPRKRKEERALKKAIKKQAREARREAEIANGLAEKAKIEDVAPNDQEMKDVPAVKEDASDDVKPVVDPAPENQEDVKPDVSSQAVKVEQ